MSLSRTSVFFSALTPYFVFQMEYDKYFCNNSDSDSFNFLIASISQVKSLPSLQIILFKIRINTTLLANQPTAIGAFCP